MTGEPTSQIAVGSDQATGHRPHDRWVRVGWWVMWGSIAARVIVVLVVTRAWFFTNDDWDYLGRDGPGQVFEPHQSHLNVLNAIAALAVRQLAGLEYWPGYALVVAVAWPVVALAAWWVWRRRGVHPLVASGGAVFITWMGSATYMQFSHVNPAWAIAATLIALEFDERRVSARNTGVGLVLSLVAVFASSVGAAAVGIRLALSLLYRQWNGAVTAGVSFAAYLIVRAVVAEPLSVSFGIGDIPTFLRAVVQALGRGLHWLVPFPTGFEGVAGILLIVAAVAIIVLSRLSYHATTMIVAGGAWLASGITVKFLNWWGIGSDRLNRFLEFGGADSHISGSRFANVAVTLLVVAALPVLCARIPFDRIHRTTRVVGIAAFTLIAAFSGVQGIRMLNVVSDKSVQLAETTGGFVAMQLAGEPRLETANQRQVDYEIGPFRLVRVAAGNGAAGDIDFNPRAALRLDQIDWFIERGWADDILRSSIYDVHGIAPDTDWSRALARFDFSEAAFIGTWADLGQEDAKGCVPLDHPGPMDVHATTRFKLTWVNDPATIWLRIIDGTLQGPESTHRIVLSLTDDFGRSEIGIEIDLLTEEPRGTVSIEVMGPEGGIGRPVLTITGPQSVSICHLKADGEA